jgi:OmpA-OmpF porin, OOP family
MKRNSLIAVAALAFSAAASAQTYGVVSAGASRHSIDCAGATTCDRSGSAFKLLGGYKFTSQVAGEAGYFDYGKSNVSGGSASLGVKVNGFGAGVAFHGDFSPNWTGVARLGIAQLKTKLDASMAGVGFLSDSDNNVALYGGLGVGYRISKMVTIDGAWDFTRGKYDKNGLSESGGVNAFSLGVTFSF